MNTRSVLNFLFGPDLKDIKEERKRARQRLLEASDSLSDSTRMLTITGDRMASEHLKNMAKKHG